MFVCFFRIKEHIPNAAKATNALSDGGIVLLQYETNEKKPFLI